MPTENVRATFQLMGTRRWLPLEIQGSVIVCTFRAWSFHSTLYLPPEPLQMRIRHLRDSTRLLQLPIALVLGALSYGLIALALSGPNTEAGWEPTVWMVNGLLAAGSFGIVASLGWMAIAGLYYNQPRTLLNLRIYGDGVPGAGEWLRVWYDRGKNAAQDRFVDALDELLEHTNHSEPLPQGATGYAWSHVRPTRRLVVHAAQSTAALYIALLIVRIGLPYALPDFVLPTWTYGLFALPWLVVAGQWVLSQVITGREPQAFQKGLHAYDREDFEAAERSFLKTLREIPSHVPSLYFLIGVYANRLDVEQAFEYCRKLSGLAPEQAEEIQGDLWRLKRMKARMERPRDDAHAT